MLKPEALMHDKTNNHSFSYDVIECMLHIPPPCQNAAPTNSPYLGSGLITIPNVSI